MLNKFHMLVLPHTFKNMKEVYEFMGKEYIDSTNSRKSLFKELDQYCDYNKNKRKIIITNIHNSVRAKQDGRVNNQGGNNVKYSDDVDQLILFLLHAHHAVDETLSGWQSYLSLCSGNLYEFAEEANHIAEDAGYPVWYAWDFFATVRNLFNSQIKRSFTRLHKQRLVEVYKKTFIIDTNGDYIEATEKQIEDVNEIKNKLLDEMGYRNLQVCIMFGKYFEYTSKLDDRLLDLDVFRMFDKYELVRMMGQDFDDSVSIRDFTHYGETSMRLNEYICKSIIDNATKRKENAKQRQAVHDEWGFGVPSEYEKLPYSVKQRASETYDYVEFYKKMVDKYIRFPEKDEDQE